MLRKSVVLKTKTSLTRYFAAALPGIAVECAGWMWRLFHDARRVSAGTLLLLVGWGATNRWLTVHHPETIDPFGRQMVLLIVPPETMEALNQTSVQVEVRFTKPLHRNQRKVELTNPAVVYSLTGLGLGHTRRFHEPSAGQRK
jgi:hypothetical protein